MLSSPPISQSISIFLSLFQNSISMLLWISLNLKLLISLNSILIFLFYISSSQNMSENLNHKPRLWQKSTNLNHTPRFEFIILGTLIRDLNVQVGMTLQRFPQRNDFIRYLGCEKLEGYRKGEFSKFLIGSNKRRWMNSCFKIIYKTEI